MLTIGAIVFLALGTLTVFLSSAPGKREKRELDPRAHGVICCMVFAVGCVVRLWQLGTLPEGLSAEEALVGVQAKALWQTGGFLYSGKLTTQFAQWSGETGGPLLAAITAPFVGLLGMGVLPVRLPLALLSCAAMPAAYGVGYELSGKRAGRWMLVIYAFSPFFVLAARTTYGAFVSVCLLPIAMYFVVRGMRSPAALYAGMVFVGLMAYTQNMYLFVAPVMVLAGVFAAVWNGVRRRDAVLASALGLLVCMPAILTLMVNLGAGEGFVLLNLIEIPKLQGFEKAKCLITLPTTLAALITALRTQVYAVFVGGVMQVLMHSNLSNGLFAPDGMGALYFLSLPLMALGAVSLFTRRVDGVSADPKVAAGRLFVKVSVLVTVVLLVLFGSAGMQLRNGRTDVLDYSALFFFDALLMAAGLCRLERTSGKGAGVMSVLIIANFAVLCVYLFGGGYQMNANVYFRGFADASVRAAQIQNETGAKVNVTSTVYPHIQPSDAAEIMYLYGSDADMNALDENKHEVIYPRGMENPDCDQVYLVTQDDVVSWDIGMFEYEEFGEYVLLSPNAGK